MRTKLLSIVLLSGLCGSFLFLGTDVSNAAPKGERGAPTREYTSVDQLPNGIRNKVDENGNYREGQRGFNPNSRWGQAIRQIQIYNQGGCEKTGTCERNTVVAETASTVVVCPTSLDDEAMRLCLGLPAVKKTVRVKKLNVQLGDAQ